MRVSRAFNRMKPEVGGGLGGCLWSHVQHPLRAGGRGVRAKLGGELQGPPAGAHWPPRLCEALRVPSAYVGWGSGKRGSFALEIQITVKYTVDYLCPSTERKCVRQVCVRGFLSTANASGS